MSHNCISGTSKKVLGLFLPLLLAGITLLGSAEKAEKKKGKAFLGVSVINLTEEKLKENNVTHGVQVLRVEKGEAADKAGIVKNDIIQFFNNQKVSEPEDLTDELADLKPDDAVKIKLMRDGKPLEVTAKLGEREDADFFTFDFGPSSRMLFAGRAKSYFLGVQLLELNEDLAGYFSVKASDGILVTGVEKDSPAAKAGIKAGDVITQVNGEKVKDAEDVSDALTKTKEGKAEVSLVRKGKSLTLSAEPEKRRGLGYIYRYGPDRGRFRVRLPRMNMYMPYVDNLREYISDTITPYAEIWSAASGEKVHVSEEAVKKFKKEMRALSEKVKVERDVVREKIQKEMDAVKTKIKLKRQMIIRI